MALHHCGVLHWILLFVYNNTEADDNKITVIDIVDSCSSGPVTCDFEGSSCGFQLSGHWNNVRGRYSADVGKDIPSAHSKDGYIVIDYKTKTDISTPDTLTSTCLSSGSYKVVFWYFCVGKDVGLSVRTSNGQVLLKDKKDSERKWKILSLTIHEEQQFQIIFEMQSSGFQYIGLDDVMIERLNTVTTPDPNIPLTLPLSCQFMSSNDTCGFTLGERWSINHGPYVYKGHATLITAGEGGTDTFALFDSETNTNSSLANGMTSSYLTSGSYTLSFWFIAPATNSQIDVVTVPVKGNETIIWTGKGRLSVWTHHAIQISSQQIFRIVLRGHIVYRRITNKLPTTIGMDNMTISITASSSTTTPFTTLKVSSALTTLRSKSTSRSIASMKSSSMPKTRTKGKPTSTQSSYQTNVQTTSVWTTLRVSTSPTVLRTTKTLSSASTTAKYSTSTDQSTSSLKSSSMPKSSTIKISTALVSSHKSSTLTMATSPNSSPDRNKHRTTTMAKLTTQPSTTLTTTVFTHNITTNSINKTKTVPSPSVYISTKQTQMSTPKSNKPTKGITKRHALTVPSHTQTSGISSVAPNKLSTNQSPPITPGTPLTSKTAKFISLFTTKSHSKASQKSTHRSTRVSTTRHTTTLSSTSKLTSTSRSKTLSPSQTSTKLVTERPQSSTLQTTIASTVPLLPQPSPSLSSHSSRWTVTPSTHTNSTLPSTSTPSASIQTPSTSIPTTTLKTSKPSRLTTPKISTTKVSSTTTFPFTTSTETQTSSHRPITTPVMTTSVKPHSFKPLLTTSHISKASSIVISTTKTFNQSSSLASSKLPTNVTQKSNKPLVTTPITKISPKTKESTNATAKPLPQTTAFFTRTPQHTPSDSDTSVGKSVSASGTSITALHTTREAPSAANTSLNTYSTDKRYEDTTVSTQTSTQNTNDGTSEPSTKITTVNIHPQTTTNVQGVSSVTTSVSKTIMTATKRNSSKVTSQKHSTSTRVTRIPLPSSSRTINGNTSAQKEKGKMKTTTIIGIVVGVLGSLIVALGVLYLYMRKQGKVTNNSVKYIDDEEATFEHYTKRTSRELRLNTINGAKENNYSAVNLQPSTGPEPSARDSKRSFQNI